MFGLIAAIVDGWGPQCEYKNTLKMLKHLEEILTDRCEQLPLRLGDPSSQLFLGQKQN